MLDEASNVVPLYHQLDRVASEAPGSYELIFIDDGSRDGTADRLREAAASDERVTVVELTRRFGQTPALAAGIRIARGEVIVPLDADLQNDPADIPRLVEKLDEPPGWDIVSGRRARRQDRALSRRLPSAIANRLVRRLTWTPEVRDFGCSMKAYRRTVLEDVRLYGEMHRFLPAVCKWRGARVTELPVNHRPRVSGTSKYGLKRTVKVLLDLITVKFLGDYLLKPIYFFGKLSIGLATLGVFSLGLAVAQKLGHLTEHGQPVNLNDNVFVTFALMVVLASVMFLMMGVISELLVRIYHESQGLPPYKIRRVTRCGETAASEHDATPRPARPDEHADGPAGARSAAYPNHADTPT
jgi:glycosyltransferase involved in cell wall biosynthesis